MQRKDNKLLRYYKGGGNPSFLCYHDSNPKRIMFYTSEKTTLSNQVYSFMCGLYPDLEEVDIEVIPTDLSEDNVFGWTMENNDQQEIQIHHLLTNEEYITCLLYTSPSPRD